MDGHIFLKVKLFSSEIKSEMYWRPLATLCPYTLDVYLMNTQEIHDSFTVLLHTLTHKNIQHKLPPMPRYHFHISFVPHPSQLPLLCCAHSHSSIVSIKWNDLTSPLTITHKQTHTGKRQPWEPNKTMLILFPTWMCSMDSMVLGFLFVSWKDILHLSSSHSLCAKQFLTFSCLCEFSREMVADAAFRKQWVHTSTFLKLQSFHWINLEVEIIIKLF